MGRRDHFRSDGTRKIPLSKEEAQAAAAELTARAEDGIERHAYRCSHCPAYHVGRAPAPRPPAWLSPADYAELGLRVCGILIRENVGARHARQERIVRLARVVEKKRRKVAA